MRRALVAIALCAAGCGSSESTTPASTQDATTNDSIADVTIDSTQEISVDSRSETIDDVAVEADVVPTRAPTCPAASPNDTTPDDDALQGCLDAGGTIVLDRGTPGYLLAKGLTISKDGTKLTSTADGLRARLVAAPSLAAPLLQMNGRASVTITWMEIDGARATRTGISTCKGYRIFGTNVALEGSTNFHFTDNVSTHAMCGSALQINGTGFEVARNEIVDNGHGTEAIDAPEPWSDGITLGLCAGGKVHDNHIVDATDVAIVDGGGAGCALENNVIEQTTRHAFAGIALHVFTAEGKGDHTGTTLTHNTITAAVGKLAFGLSIGMHPWDTTVTATGGTVTANHVSGAIVDLQVDGVSGTTVTGNVLTAAGGAPKCGGAPALYTTAHASGATLDPGSISRVYDKCIP